MILKQAQIWTSVLNRIYMIREDPTPSP